MGVATKCVQLVYSRTVIVCGNNHKVSYKFSYKPQSQSHVRACARVRACVRACVRVWKFLITILIFITNRTFNLLQKIHSIFGRVHAGSSGM